MDEFLQECYAELIASLASIACVRNTAGLSELVESIIHQEYGDYGKPDAPFSLDFVDGKLHSVTIRPEPGVTKNYYLFEGEICDNPHPFMVYSEYNYTRTVYYSSERIENDEPIVIINNKKHETVELIYNKYNSIDPIIDCYTSKEVFYYDGVRYGDSCLSFSD